MAKDVLISAIDQYISGFQAEHTYFPRVTNVINHVDIIIPTDVTFTNQDIADVANYCVSKYPNTYTYEDWGNVMVDYLSYRIVSDPILLLPPVTQTQLIPSPSTEPFKISTNMLLIGGAILLFLFMSREKKTGV